MLQRALESPADEPGVECIVAVLNQDCAVRETQEGPARITEFGCPDQHRPVDVVPLFGVRIDGRATIDQSVKKGKRP
jgi:hypothetical protein